MRITFSFVSLLCPLAAISIQAGSIALNLGSEAPAGMMAPEDKAGLPLIAQTNWNNAPGASGSLKKLKDDSGTPTDVQADWHSGLGVWEFDPVTASGDSKMMRSYLDAGAGKESAAVTFSGIPYAWYDVIVYFDGGDNDGRIGAYTVDGVTVYGKDSAAFRGEYIECEETELKNAKPGNYVRFTGLVGPNVTVKAEGAATQDEYLRAAINGIQIVEVPAPRSFDDER